MTVPYTAGKMKYGLTVYYRVLLAFETMPISATIATSYGKIFACHGGISPLLTTLDDIEKIDRFTEPDMKGALCDLLWADPVSEGSVLLGITLKLTHFVEGIREMDDEQYKKFLEIDWKPNPIRGCSNCFGYAAIKKFLTDNNLLCMIRAHEVQEQGFARHFDPGLLEARLRKHTRHSRNLSSLSFHSDFFSEDGGSEYDEFSDSGDEAVEFPPVITIFSAPNYCDRYSNKVRDHIHDSENTVSDFIKSETISNSSCSLTSYLC
jgi:serine/threonine-protein phosphatase 2B catalytic subunit